MKRLFFLFLFLPVLLRAQPAPAYDICVYGATSAGVIAAYTARMLGRSVVLVTPGTHTGGLTAGGLGFTDIGNKYAVTGLALDFYRRTGRQYGKFESWIFEPHVASAIFAHYIDTAHVPVLYRSRLLSVQKEQGLIKSIAIDAGDGKDRRLIKARMFIDCSYEGDLMAKAGVSYSTGREANSMYKEVFNGVQVHKGNQFPDGVDPYKTPGDPNSGLLWGISSAALPPAGSGDKKVQAYNFRICLTNDPANRIPITRPPGYDSTRYELLLRCMAQIPNVTLRHIVKMDMMPNHKTDINNNGGFSTDMIGMNWDYPDAGEARRDTIRRAHEEYDKGLLYFIGHDPRVPASVREAMLPWGYPKDEYTANDHWSPQLYIREARRMLGEYVMTQANCEGKETVSDGIAMAAYGMDSHNTDRLVINGMVKNEGDVQRGVAGPYPVSYRSIIPKAQECHNLLVPVCLSASHIAYGSIRMEPVFMVLGQSAATAAVLAVQEGKTVQQVDIKRLQQLLAANPLANGSEPELLVDDRDKEQVEIKGEWQYRKGDGYGPGYLAARGDSGGEKSIKFIPAVRKSGVYNVYTYMLPRLKNLSSQTLINVADESGLHPVTVRKSGIGLQGQTSGEWVFLGSFKWSKGNTGYVEITGREADGEVVADAVLLVPAGTRH